MEIQVREYDLPDEKLLHTQTVGIHYLFWVPDRPYIVLGLSNHPQESLIAETIRADNITVLKRPSGGQAVLLSPATLVIAILERQEQLPPTKSFFYKWNQAILDALTSLGVARLHMRGTSDLAIGDKKILGCAIYRQATAVFYHAVLNIAESPDTIARYLQHPPREPDYRRGRPHTDFVTSLAHEGYAIAPSQIAEQIERNLGR